MSHMLIWTSERGKRTFFRGYSRQKIALIWILICVGSEVLIFSTFQELTHREVTHLPSQTFTVSGPPTLVIQTDAGHVFLSAQPGDSNQVFVFGYKDDSGFGSFSDDIVQQIHSMATP